MKKKGPTRIRSRRISAGIRNSGPTPSSSTLMRGRVAAPRPWIHADWSSPVVRSGASLLDRRRRRSAQGPVSDGAGGGHVPPPAPITRLLHRVHQGCAVTEQVMHLERGSIEG